jgi:3-hydroxyacyl-[acyl-carrier-protein] dehydratase
MKTTMDIHEILNYLPHRYPFLLVDRVSDIILGKSIVAIKNVTSNEPFFVGHFPQRMVMPGVLILEALAQASCLLAIRTAYSQNGEGDDSESLYFFAGLDNVRFKRVVEPGDQLRLEVEIVRYRQDVWKFKGTATVDGHLVCSADMTSARRDTA